MSAALDLFANGAPLDALTPDVVEQIRAEIRAAREARAEMVKMLAAWDAGLDLLRHLSQEAWSEGAVRLEAWHPDPWILGYAIGEGTALMRVASTLHTVTLAMKLVELGGVDEERSDG